MALVLLIKEILYKKVFLDENPKTRFSDMKKKLQKATKIKKMYSKKMF